MNAVIINTEYDLEEEIDCEIIPRKGDLIRFNGQPYVSIDIIFDYDENRIEIWIQKK